MLELDHLAMKKGTRFLSPYSAFFLPILIEFGMGHFLTFTDRTPSKQEMSFQLHSSILIPVLALIGSWTLEFRESVSLEDPKYLWKLTTAKKKKCNLITNLIIIYLLILRCPD